MSRRIRSIKPEWLEDQLMSRASSDARVLSIALIIMADDYGNGRCSDLTVAPEVFPPESKSPEDLMRVYRRFHEALMQLSEMRFVAEYKVNGQDYYTIRNWNKHQKVQHPGKPLVPGPPESLWSVSRESHESLTPDLRPTTNEERQDIISSRESHEERAQSSKSLDPMADSFKQTLHWQRTDVRQVFDAWKQSVGMTGARCESYSNPHSEPIATAIDAYGLTDCLLVANHCMQDGMVNGSADEQKKPHDTTRYIFGNLPAFERILTAARKKKLSKSQPSYAEQIARQKSL